MGRGAYINGRYVANATKGGNKGGGRGRDATGRSVGWAGEDGERKEWQRKPGDEDTELERKFDVDILTPGETRRGYLFNVKTTRHYDEGGRALSGLLLYFFQRDGRTFRCTFLYRGGIRSSFWGIPHPAARPSHPVMAWISSAVTSYGRTAEPSQAWPVAEEDLNLQAVKQLKKTFVFCGILTFASIALGFLGRSLDSPWKELVMTSGFALIPMMVWMSICRSLPRLQTTERVEQRVWAPALFKELDELKFMSVQVTARRPAPSVKILGEAELPAHAEPRASNVRSSVVGTSCSCCLGEFQQEDSVAVLYCGHVFCELCIAQWSVSGHALARKCPVCLETMRDILQQRFEQEGVVASIVEKEDLALEDHLVGRKRGLVKLSFQNTEGMNRARMNLFQEMRGKRRDAGHELPESDPAVVREECRGKSGGSCALANGQEELHFIMKPLRGDAFDIGSYIHSMSPPIEKMDSSLNQLVNVRHLSLSTNCIDKMISLPALKNIEILSLGRNLIKKISGLEEIGSTLRELWISYNQISTLDGLAPCVKLTTLFISNNKIKDWPELDKLQANQDLSNLMVFGNPIYEGLTRKQARPKVLEHLPKIATLDGELLTGDDDDGGEEAE
ncbi:unnamed protein product [Effrenium voratum]|nr:unnamed protein product [Effrenium voratum]